VKGAVEIILHLPSAVSPRFDIQMGFTQNRDMINAHAITRCNLTASKFILNKNNQKKKKRALLDL